MSLSTLTETVCNEGSLSLFEPLRRRSGRFAESDALPATFTLPLGEKFPNPSWLLCDRFGPRAVAVQRRTVIKGIVWMIRI
ncbi:hypothetical protein CDAR_441971 [Caerostris darwini]|uniref:Uncharacterized protein n=1 Tax=Caerostris darwini TaxID=1538125 RepID=A0AAV4S4L5_9ARAC|nr:hypothetical protein CDAR_441971 [Caerostris darwini]